MEPFPSTLPAGTEAEEHLSAFCPRFHLAVEIIGRRWSGAILRALLSGRTRYSDLCSSVPGLSDRLLSERLKEFEAEGILERRVIPETPVRIEYHLTDKGRDLEKAFGELAHWAEKWIEPDPGYDPAQACGTGHPDAGHSDGGC